MDFGIVSTLFIVILCEYPLLVNCRILFGSL